MMPRFWRLSINFLEISADNRARNTRTRYCCQV